MTNPYNKRPIDTLMESDALGLRDHFRDRRTAIASQVCVARYCLGDGTATAFRDQLSQKEYNISGLCQTCQDTIFGGGDELRNNLGELF